MRKMPFLRRLWCRRSSKDATASCGGIGRSDRSSRRARRRPNELVRRYRTDNWFTDGKRILVWEYPRQAPDGGQIELMEVMEIEHGLIQHHRIYWGWFGVNQLTQNGTRKATLTT